MANDKQVKFFLFAEDQASGKLAQVERGFSSVKDAVFSLQGAISAIGITAALTAATAAANQAERASIGLAVTARYAGESIDATLTAARALTEDGLLSMTEASQGLQNLLQRGFALPEAIVLMNRFKEAAAFNRQASLEFGEAVVTATEGLKNENSVLVDNAGVTKNVSVMHKEYAAELGKTVEQMSMAEKRQAEYNGILRETEGQVGNASRMAGTFAGEQARLNQEIFNTKAALGTALIPALNDALPILRQMVGVTGEFIGGVQMMAVETAAFIDRVNVIGSVDWFAILGEATFADARAGIEREFAVIANAVEAQKAEIYPRLTMTATPDIGADTGSRRTDAAPAAGGGGSRGASKKSFSQQAWAQSTSLAQQAWLADQKLLSDAEREAFEQSVEYAIRRQELEASTSSNIKQMQTEIAASRLQSAMDFMGAEEVIHQQRLVTLEEEYQKKIDSADQIGADTTLITQEYELQKTRLEQEHSNERVRIAFEEEQRKKQAQDLAWQNYAVMQQGLYTLAQGNSSKLMKLYQATTIPVALANAYKAASGAMADTPGPWYVRAAAYAAALGQGLVAYNAIRQVVGGDSGGGGSPGYGGGTPGSPVVTQPGGGQAPPAQSFTIVIEGNILGEDRYVEERLAPLMRELASRNVDFGFSTR